MKMISATIRPFRLDDVKQALRQLGRLATVSEVETFSPPPPGAEHYRGEYTGGFVPKVRIDVIVPSNDVEKTIEIIRRAALTGRLGDGIIVVTSVEKLVRIRTGALGEDAL